jgi:CheY-like chemotaxis protein
MTQGRILVVDDLPDVRSTICGLLEDAGYTAKSVSSVQEALQQLELERFHAAVLDIRLDDTDVDNQEGMALMHTIAGKYPSMVIIVLTGYATVERVQEALQQNPQGITPAYKFLTKAKISELPDAIQSAFRYRIKINHDLRIDDTHQCLDKLTETIRFRITPPPSKVNLKEEIEEIFKRLFYDCEVIQILPLQQGFSGSVVFRVDPVYRDKGRGESLVVKIGDARSIKDEEKNYNKFVKGIIGGHRFPTAINTIYSRWLAAILYTFAGLGEIENFVEFYKKSSKEEIIKVIENLYLKTCFPFRGDMGTNRDNFNLREFYLDHLRLYPKKLNSILDLYPGNEEFTSDGQENGLISVGEQLVENPIVFVNKADFHCDCFFSIIHGDLTGENLLVDHHQETWLIDFANTSGDGHILQDYISLENYIRLLLIESDDLNLLYRWERILYQGNLMDITLPAELSNQNGLEKASCIIQRIRTMASRTKYYSVRAYLTGLFFYNLRSLTFVDLPKTTRDHAFLSCALIAERYKKGNAYV